MKRTLLIIFILVSVVVSVSAAADIPRIEPYVNDFAGLLTPAEELQLNILADEIEQNTTFEIAIVTIEGTGGQNRVEFAGKIGDLNGVGKKDLDNGVVVMWSTQDDFGGAIATGRGSESLLTDATVGRIGKESRKFFDNEEYAVAFNYILTELNIEIIKHQTLPPVTTSTGENEGIEGFDFIFIIISLLSIPLFFKIMNYTSSSEDYSDKIYKKNGKWYNQEEDKSYNSSVAAAAAYALMSKSDDDDGGSNNNDDDNSSGSSGVSFGSFGGGSFGGGGVGF